MNSEKVKKIKEKLQEEIFIANSFGDKLRKVPTNELENLLTLINELESENESLQDLCNKTYEDLTKEIDRLESDNERLKHLREVDNTTMTTLRKSNTELNECMDEMQDRIAELEKEIEENAFYSKGYAQGIKNTYEVVIPDKLKQFAERLKEKCEYNRKQYCCEATVSFNDIDETLKEFLSTTV